MKPSRCCPIAVLALLPAVAAFAAEEPSKDKPVSKESQAALEKAFARKMSGATLVGSFTVDGPNEGRPPEPERYELGKVSKFRDDFWTFEAKIKYGKKETEAKIPITVKVLWAGETPVITVEKLTIPGMGTFDARVLVHGNRYVGTWQHGEHGGHMFGRVERAGMKDKKTSSVEAVPVSGRVNLNGKPVQKGQITFAPRDKNGEAVEVDISEGRFKTKLQPGQYDVAFSAPGVPAKYKNVNQSGVRVNVLAGENAFGFDLR